MYGPKVSMLRRLSLLSSGVPVKPMVIAPGSSAFIASCSLPDWVRWHSSTKTKTSPLARKPLGRPCLISATKASMSLSPISSPAPNLWISEPISHSWLALSTCTRSAPLLVR